MAAAQALEVATPTPVVRRAGSYTVFLTPPATPSPSEPLRVRISSPEPESSPICANAAPSPPPVQVPPQQFEKPSPAFGFFWDAVAKVQDAHSSLDEYIASWFGLNQSKYQWALNDYYESSGMDKEDTKQKELAGKGAFK